MKIKIFFACNKKLNTKSLFKIHKIEKTMRNLTFHYFITTDGIEAQIGSDKSNCTICEKKFKVLEAPSDLFDFSRYDYFLKMCDENDVVLMINDTLGDGRKFKIGLKFFIMISIILLNFKIINIAAPVDSDEIGKWISPYLLIGRASALRSMNWTDVQLASSNLSANEGVKIDNWLLTNWRSRIGANKKQFFIKKNTLILEKDLLRNAKIRLRIFSFSKANPLRILNSII